MIACLILEYVDASMLNIGLYKLCKVIMIKEYKSEKEKRNKKGVCQNEIPREPRFRLRHAHYGADRGKGFCTLDN